MHSSPFSPVAIFICCDFLLYDDHMIYHIFFKFSNVPLVRIKKKVEFIDNFDGEMYYSGSPLPCVRSTSGRSVPVILFGGDDDDVNNFKLNCMYCKCHNSFCNCLRDLVFVVRCRYFVLNFCTYI